MPREPQPDWNSFVRPADGFDARYVLDTWLSSFQGSAFQGSFSRDLYRSVYGTTIQRLINRGSKVLVVANPVNKKLILGWVCYELDLEGHPVLHYLFTKPMYRRRGIAHVLLKNAGIDPAAECFYSFKTPVIHKVINGKYRPEIARNTSVGSRKDSKRGVAEARPTDKGPGVSVHRDEPERVAESQ